MIPMVLETLHDTQFYVFVVKSVIGFISVREVVLRYFFVLSIIMYIDE